METIEIEGGTTYGNFTLKKFCENFLNNNIIKTTWVQFD